MSWVLPVRAGNDTKKQDLGPFLMPFPTRNPPPPRPLNSVIHTLARCGFYWRYIVLQVLSLFLTGDTRDTVKESFIHFRGTSPAPR